MTRPKNPTAAEATDPLPLPGLVQPPAGANALKIAAHRTLAALKEDNLLLERHALTAQLILDLADVVAIACGKGQASAAALAAAQVLAALETLLPEVEGGDPDAYDQLAADLREAAMESSRSAAKVRDKT